MNIIGNAIWITWFLALLAVAYYFYLQVRKLEDDE